MEYRGPWDDIDIPDTSLYGLIFEGLDEQDAQRVAFDHAETGQVLTMGQVKHDVDAVASWLSARGIGSSDVVAIALQNRPEYAAAFHGVARTGAASTLVNVASHASEVERQLRITGAKVLITDAQLLSSLGAAAEAVGLGARDVVVLDADDPAGHVGWHELLDTPIALPEVSIDPATHVACLPMSSGTSGMPKAVMLSHRNLVGNILQFAAPIASLPEHTSFISFLPYSHIYSLTTNLNLGLFRRWTQLTMTSFQARLMLELVATRKPQMLLVVPPVASFLARTKAVEAVDWSPVQLVISGAAALDQATGDLLEQRLGVRLIQGYGMTELSPVSHVLPIERRDIGLGTIGQVISNCRFRVVDPDSGADVAPVTEPGQWSAPGELWVKGPNTMLGYLEEPEASDAVLDADGWVHTGDMVQVDHEGTVRIVDRIKELIKRRGYQIAPVELEGHLLQHPDVADAAVVGVGSNHGDQTPHALLVLNDGVEADGAVERILGWLNPQVASYKRIGQGNLVEALPRSAAGKILRRQLLPLVV